MTITVPTGIPSTAKTSSVKPSSVKPSTSTPTLTPTQTPEHKSEVQNNCGHGDKTFDLGTAARAIKAFCASDIVLLTPSSPIYQIFISSKVHLVLAIQWSQAGQDGCNSRPKLDNTITAADCSTWFTNAVNNCETDTRSAKLGNMPLVWNSPGGCVDFYIAAHDASWRCEDNSPDRLCTGRLLLGYTPECPSGCEHVGANCLCN